MVSEIFLFYSAAASVSGMNTIRFALAAGVIILGLSSAIWVCFVLIWLFADCLAAGCLVLVFGLTSEAVSVFFIFSYLLSLGSPDIRLVSQFFAVVTPYF